MSESGSVKGALIGAVVALVLAVGLLAPLTFEGRFEALAGWVFGPTWEERTARVSEIDCVREAGECTDDGRFTLTYRYQFEGQEYESERIAPDWLLEGFDEQWHRERQEQFADAKLHSRPVQVHINSADPDQAMLFRPAGLPAMAIAAVVGGLLLLLSVGLFLRGRKALKQLR